MMDESKEGLLSPSQRYHQSSVDPEARRSLSSDDGSDLDATDFLTTDPLAGRRPFRNRSRCCIITCAAVLIIWLVLGAGGATIYTKFQAAPAYGQSPPWYPTPNGGSASGWAESYRKAAAMVQNMTLAEKVNVTTGTGWMMGLAVGTNGPAVHVGFPQLQLQDGPLGLRFADNASAFPAGVTVGATWNKELMYSRGKAHGNEARGKGINVLLGPCVGPLGRMPAGGRNWEGFGSDPYLQGIAAAETIKGIQSEGVMATIKHFVGNEQEHFRQPWEWALPNAISSNIDDRTLHELYAWPFGDSVRAGVASVMCSYNQVNNSYVCQNSKLLNGILKDELGFQGFIMSDWGAQQSGVASALAGLDMTMPGDGARFSDGLSYWGPELTRSVMNGSVPLERLNDMVSRIVAAWYQLGQDDKTKFDGQGPNFSSWTNDRFGTMAPGSETPQESVEVNKFVNVQGDHKDIARAVAREGIVLLKNKDLLPIDRMGFTDAKKKSKKRDLRERHMGKLKIGIFGEDAGPGKGPNVCMDRACNDGTLGSGWGSGAVEFPYLVPPVLPLREGFNMSKVQWSEYLTNNPSFDSDPSILDQDVCIVFGNADAGEGYVRWSDVAGDRPDLSLQKGADDLIVKVAEGCGGGTGEVLVVIHAVGPVVMEKWVDLPNVKAVLLANLPGQESGNALADIIFGDESPSGHLPYTIGKSLDDYGAGGQIMYLPNGVVPQQDFSEGLYIDYRYFDKKDIAPRFEFGFGLSYTTFDFSDLQITQIKDKTALPAARPQPGATPPKYSDELPDASEALWPADIRKLDKYIYPYVDTVEELVADPYPYPDGYKTKHALSPAGGDEGGNPDLWETYVSVHVNVTNTGAKAGKAVAQLYLSYPSPQDGKKAVDFPVRVLRGFEKVHLEQKEVRTVEFNLTRRDLSYWDAERQNWVLVTTGQYTFTVGQSSRDPKATSGKW
ncbi:family 3 glycoside hydrolase [Cryphonectria parasitica EP155]|uniref:beta-glucosidase n=1 Tax=Cryphonectria parasitica (strain ATCC 38755 / EP155) TaxID=660469 RepID=A0A9P4Y2J9_CRYP1|nr:family 3 glycoside hydrolase [Cryphonectria parasitica EP155]KAF3765192.1 family 3 glycoside hydrolase [Cryphonectria parasitica EP155]